MTDEYAVLTALYERMPAERKRAFWQLKGTRADKQAYLMRRGHFEAWKPTEQVA